MKRYITLTILFIPRLRLNQNISRRVCREIYQVPQQVYTPVYMYKYTLVVYLSGPSSCQQFVDRVLRGSLHVYRPPGKSTYIPAFSYTVIKPCLASICSALCVSDYYLCQVYFIDIKEITVSIQYIKSKLGIFIWKLCV